LDTNAINSDRHNDQHETVIQATAVSRGVAAGRAVCLFGTKRQYFLTHIENSAIDHEIGRFRTAVTTASKQLNDLIKSPDIKAKSSGDIFDAHLMMLEHSTLAADVEAFIRSALVTAEWALRRVAENFSNKQAAVSDANLRDRIADFEDLCDRVLNALDGKAVTLPVITSDSVIVASIIRPSTLIELGRQKPSAIVTEHGGWTSHSFILARELKIPAVTGVKSALKLIRDGTSLSVDGFTGALTIDPSSETLEQIKSHTFVAEPIKFDAASTRSTTIDGREIILRANIDLVDPAPLLAQTAAKGVGLLRSEYLFQDVSVGYPSEDAQFEAYKLSASNCGPEGVRIRTFDLQVDQVNHPAEIREMNPALGLRGLRLSLADRPHFREQIRAILRAGAYGNVSMVLPMVSGVADLSTVREMIADETAALAAQGTPVPPMPLGAMIEMPSAVLTVDDIAKHADFLCLGTNDLVQYLLSADRDNESVAHNYQTLHPSVVRSISMVFRAADLQGKSTVVCGEMAGSPFYLPLLIGLGAREFSMNPDSLGAIRQVIGRISFDECRELARKASVLETADAIEAYMNDFYRRNWPHVFPGGISSST